MNLFDRQQPRERPERPERSGRPRRRSHVVLVALPLLAALAGLPASAPTSALGRLPSCDLGDVYTVPRGYDEWSITLVDRLLRVGKDYVPPDLVHVSEAGLPGGGHIRAVAVDDTKAMARAARAAGAPIGVWSAYRSYAQQQQIFTGYARQNGFDSAITYSQRPGHSEHQLGLGVDFMSAAGGDPLQGDWATTAAGAWMRDNSWTFGWVNSYPRGKDGARWNDRTCLRYEPWHYRYLGREVARKVHRSGLTIREYLWRNHTQLDSRGRPLSTSTPRPSARPSGDPPTTASPSQSSTPAPTTVSSTRPAAISPLAPPGSSQSPVLDSRIVVGGLLAFLAVLTVGLVARRRRHRQAGELPRMQGGPADPADR